MKKYVIGIDFGTLSGRAVLIDALNGSQIAEATHEYAHGVMDESLPCGKALPPKYALQYPGDYLDVLRVTIHQILESSGISRSDIAGIGVDFTACTLMPLDEDGVPLCMKEEFKSEPHAYVKLWKHHAAQPYADEINVLALARGEKWHALYGGKLSCEFALPKMLQVLREAPEVYGSAARFAEAADWISFILTGNETASVSFAGYKACWNAESGYPSEEFFAALDPRFSKEKLCKNVLGMDKIAGVLSKEGARLTGLEEGTVVALPQIDGHSSMPALRVTRDGTLLMTIGTSTCHLINCKEQMSVDGICGYVKDGVIPGYYTYEAGQAGVGDIFHWFVKNGVPASYEIEAEERGISVQSLLTEKAEKKKAGENRLIALDWVNGNRSVLVNSSLSGMMLGMTLNTKAEDIYRAWIESTAYGTRMIIDNYENCGIRVNDICAGGGIAQKNGMMMQIYADVTGRKIRISKTTQAGALGSAIYAAVAAGIYKSIDDAAKAMSAEDLKVYVPDTENSRIYDSLYDEYKKLHDYFGRGENDVMEKLLHIEYAGIE